MTTPPTSNHEMRAQIYPQAEPPASPPAYDAAKGEPTLPGVGGRFIAQTMWSENLSPDNRLRTEADHLALVLLTEFLCEMERLGEGCARLSERIEARSGGKMLLVPELPPGWRDLDEAASCRSNLDDLNVVGRGVVAAHFDGPAAIARAGLATLQRSPHFERVLGDVRAEGYRPQFMCFCGKRVEVRRRRTSAARYAPVERAGAPVLNPLLGVVAGVEDAPAGAWDSMAEADRIERAGEWLPRSLQESRPRLLGTLECEACARNGAPPLCRHEDVLRYAVLPCWRPTRDGRLFCWLHDTKEWGAARRQGELARRVPDRPAAGTLRPAWRWLLRGGAGRVERERDLWAEFDQVVSRSGRRLRERLNVPWGTEARVFHDDLAELCSRFQSALDRDLKRVEREGVESTFVSLVVRMLEHRGTTKPRSSRREMGVLGAGRGARAASA